MLNRLHLISVFVAVVDAASFAKAARKLNVSASAVTRAISELEADLGVRLLTRTTRAVRVTEDGDLYAQSCRRILAELAEADAVVSGKRAVPHGRLTLTAPALFGARFLTPIVNEYLTRYAEVKVSCLFLDQAPKLMEEGIDVAVRIGEQPDSTMHAIHVGQVRQIICATPEYFSRLGQPIRPAELVGHSIIAVGPGKDAATWRFVEKGEPCLVVLPARLTTTTSDSAVLAALDSFGLTSVFGYLVADDLRHGRLIEVLPEFAAPAQPVYLVYSGGRYRSERVRAFVDLCRERLRADRELNPD